ncbi:MAG: hypothetical protein ACJ74Q_15210 [Pyrinomonadaceae bacterium]
MVINMAPVVREYLLGALADVEAESIELRLLSEAGFRLSVELERDELIEDYVLGLLGARERRLFESNFLRAPANLFSVKIVESLADYFAAPRSG